MPVVVACFLIVFFLILFAVSAGLKFFEARRKKQVVDMLQTAAGEPVVAVASLLKEMEPEREAGVKGLLRSLQFTRHAQEQLQQAGLNWPATRLLTVMGIMTIPGFLLGMAFPILLSPLATATVFAAVCGILPYLYVRAKRKKRLDTLEEQFPESLDFLSRSMRAGHAFTISLEMVGEEMADPLGQEFRALFNEQNLGAPLDIALQQLQRPGAAAGRPFLHLVGAAAETDGRQPERDPDAAGVRDPRAVPAERPGESGQRAWAPHGHDPDRAAGGHDARTAGGGAGIPAGHGRGPGREEADRRGDHRPGPGEHQHQEDHKHQGVTWNIR